MVKRSILAVVVVYVFFALSDFLIHGVLLSPIYQETSSLWRPGNEIKYGLYQVVALIYSISFVGVYACLVTERTVRRGVRYGFIFGIGASVAMGHGSYCFMPIPYSLAFSWFAGMLIQCVIAGLFVGLIVRESR